MAIMEYTEKLPAEIDPEMWFTHGWNWQKCMDHSRTLESEEWCHNRTEQPTRTAKALLSQLRESDAMWLGLRRHLEVSEAIFVLQVLVEHSGWREIKRTDNEKNRKAYHKLCDECRYFCPGWEHTEMKERQTAARAKAKAAARAASGAASSEDGAEEY